MNFKYLNAQIKTLIPADEEVNLPLDASKKIGLSTEFEETKLDRKLLRAFVLERIRTQMDASQYFILDSAENDIELLVLAPCRSFDIKNIQNHEIINEGLITSSLTISLQNTAYTVAMKNFEWVSRQRNINSLDAIFQNYLKEKDLKEKIKYYGILKSAEMSISEAYSHVMVLVEDIIGLKVGKK
jgi:hypothetical protein